MSNLNEMKKDFDDALKQIDFKAYDPYSRKFMNALFIGQILKIYGKGRQV